MVIDLDRYRKTRRLSESISFGEWVAIARKNQGLTQEQLGDRIGYSQPVVSRMETGALDIWPDDAAAIAEALNNPDLLEKYCSRCPVCRAMEKLARQPKPAA
ncbi:MAG: helix-turn-helix domain-containing protein [Desulfotomaculales bacterium]